VLFARVYCVAGLQRLSRVVSAALQPGATLKPHTVGSLQLFCGEQEQRKGAALAARAQISRGRAGPVCLQEGGRCDAFSQAPKRISWTGLPRFRERCSQLVGAALGAIGIESERDAADFGSWAAEGPCGHGLEVRTRCSSAGPRRKAGREAPRVKPLPKPSRASAAFGGLPHRGPWRNHPIGAGPIRVGAGCRRSEAAVIHRPAGPMSEVVSLAWSTARVQSLAGWHRGTGVGSAVARTISPLSGANVFSPGAPPVVAPELAGGTR